METLPTTPSFISCFAKLKDPRKEEKINHKLSEILLIVLCGTICGANSWRDYVTFGESKLSYLKKFSDFANGIPSKNTFARVFAALDSDCFKACFISWVQSLQNHVPGVIAIDGKTLKRSFDKANAQSAIHMVSAFASETGLVLGQQKTNQKSNEITAIPKLLKLLELNGCIVSIDAMGCQTKIARQIRNQSADYVLALKANQKQLYEDVSLFLSDAVDNNKPGNITDYDENLNKEHGRIETRKCYVSDQLNWLDTKDKWVDLKIIVMIESTREIAGKVSTERRFYITSMEPNARQINQSVRNHWSIENQLYWVMDVTMDEDNSRVRKGNAPENMCMIKHIVLNMLRKAKMKKYNQSSLKGLKKIAGWDNATLDSIICQNF